jgi:hypothetical protein
MFMPYVSFVGGFPVPMIVSFVGLAFFWSLILLRNVDRWEKWGQFLALTFAGMLSTHAFITGIGNLRTLLIRPDKPMYDGIGWWVLSWSQPIQWICVILLFIAIYQIAARKFSGGWLALVSVTSLVAINVPMQIIRLIIAKSTAWDYSYGLPMIIGLFFVLLHPKFKAALTIAAIYLLGNRKLSGWYYGLIGGLVTLITSGATHYVRHATNDYLYGALMGLAIVVMLLIPIFKQRLLKEYSG